MTVAASAAVPRTPLGIGRFALAHCAIGRVYTTLPLALLAFGVGAAMGVARASLLAATAAIACALAGGYAYNDLRDQSLDRLNRPRRPLVSGRMSERYVRRLVVVLFGAALLLAASTDSVRTVAFIVLLIASSCVYSDGIKDIPGVKNVFVGAWCGLLPWGAALEHVTAAALPAVMLVALFITQKELLADVHDRDGDAVSGVKTIPVVFGSRVALAIVALLNVMSGLLARVAGGVPVLVHLPAAAGIAAAVNVAVLLVVFYRTTPKSVRASLELQKVFMIGGCLGLFAALAW